MKFSLDGTDFEIDIAEYISSNNGEKVQDFLRTSISIRSTHMSYYEDSRILRCYELDELLSRVDKLVKGKIKRNEHLFFSEPVIEFRLRPATSDGEADIDMYVIVNLRDDYGVVTANSLSLLMGREDIEKLHRFLIDIVKPSDDFFADEKPKEEDLDDEVEKEDK